MHRGSYFNVVGRLLMHYNNVLTIPWNLRVAIFAVTAFACLLSCNRKRPTQAPQLVLISPTQSVCQVREECWSTDRFRTTAEFTLMGDGQFSGRRFDVWTENTNTIVTATYRGVVPMQLVTGLVNSVKHDPQWKTNTSVPVYTYGMVDFAKFDHPIVIMDFLRLALDTETPYYYSVPIKP